MHVIATLVLAATLLTGATAQAGALTLRDIVHLHAAGLDEPSLLALIEVDGGPFHVSHADVRALRDAGLSDRVIAAVIGVGRPPGGLTGTRTHHTPPDDPDAATLAADPLPDATADEPPSGRVSDDLADYRPDVLIYPIPVIVQQTHVEVYQTVIATSRKTGLASRRASLRGHAPRSSPSPRAPAPAPDVPGVRRGPIAADEASAAGIARSQGYAPSAGDASATASRAGASRDDASRDEGPRATPGVARAHDASSHTATPGVARSRSSHR